MQIIGHRGASADAPENTLEAMQLAWEQGAYGAECDILRTADGQLVLIHDDSTGRTARYGIDLPVERTPWPVLKDLDVGSWKGETWQGVRIPLLAEVLRAIPAGRHLFVEIKSGERNGGADPRVLDELEALLGAEGTAPEGVSFISFDHAFLNRLKARLPHYRAYYLTSYRPCLGRWPDVRTTDELARVLDAAVANGIDGLDLECSPPISREWVAMIHARGLQVAIWSYERDDTLENARRFCALGVDYLTTNTPAAILRGLGPAGETEDRR